VTSLVELKQEFLKLLKEDEEFRLAVAGLLGYSEVLKRLDRHEEEMRRIWESIEKLREDFLLFIKEQERRWEENNRKWEEAYKRLDRHEEEFKRVWESIERLRQDFLTFVKEQEKRWEENNKRWEENIRRWEENSRRWEEAYKRFEAIEKVLIEHTEVLREYGRRIDELSKAVRRFEIILGSIGRRWGSDLEKAVLELFRYNLKEFGVEVRDIRRFEYVDLEGRYLGRGTRVEVDIYTSDKVLYLIEVKSHARVDDINWFHTKAKVVEEVMGRKADKLIIVAVDIDKDAYDRAKELGLEVIYGAIIE